MDWNLYAWVKRGERRKEVLKTIKNSEIPITIKEIKIKCQISIAQTSFLVKQLEEKNLIICLNPKDKIGKLYKINEIGIKILKEIL